MVKIMIGKVNYGNIMKYLVIVPLVKKYTVSFIQMMEGNIGLIRGLMIIIIFSILL